MTTQEYFDNLPDERKAPMQKLRKVIAENIPEGFEERICYNMPSFVVPHAIYPAGYHCDPKLPLSFISFASQKNYIVLHHMGLYANTELLDWFTTEYSKRVNTKPDMGKGCIRFKKPDQIPFDLVAELSAKITPQQWVELYESAFRKG